MNEDLLTFVKWLLVNIPTLNVKKTQFMTFGKENSIQNLKVVVNEKPIDRVDEFKFLRLWIDSKLSFNAYVDKIKRNAVPFVTVFWKMARFIPMKQWRTVASMAPIWSNYHHNKPKAQQT